MDTQVPITIHPIVTDVGHGSTDAYVELFWLPIVGPTAAWLWRRLVSITTAAGGPVSFDVDELGAQLGVKGVAVRTTLDRLCHFGLAHQWSLTTFAVVTKAPTIRTNQLHRLPAVLQRAHADHARRDVEAVTA